MEGLSNLQNELDKVVDITTNSLEMRELGSYEVKQRIQKLVFPEGIYYNRENDHYRTVRVNSIFALSHSVSMACEGNKKGIKYLDVILSPSVASTGIEPVSKV